MSLQEEFQLVFDNIPDIPPANLTFMEISGYPHYENVCSNILKFYIQPKNKVHGLKNLVLKSLLQSLKKWKPPFSEDSNITIRREVVTNKGRIDLVILSPKWIIAIENKIRHSLDNDLQEYADFLKNSYPNKEILKLVLSLKDESENVKGGFENVTYEVFLKEIDKSLAKISISNDYVIFLKHFSETIKKFYMKINVSDAEILFLKNNNDKIEELIELRKRIELYISQRAITIYQMVKQPEEINKWVFANYDVGFHYAFKGSDQVKVEYKIECLLDVQGIQITICVEINKIDKMQLERLDFFKTNSIENFKTNEENNRVIIESDIPFSISDEKLVEKLETILEKIKISE